MTARRRGLALADLVAVNGDYGAMCTDRTGSWTLDIAGAGAGSDLSVVLHDAACVLTLTEIETTAGVLAASADILMTESYFATASSFGAPIEFYANAKISDDTFSVTIPYSDDPTLASGPEVVTTAYR